jgi:hypothetical protein
MSNDGFIVKEVLRGCQEYEDELDKLDLHSSDRLINKGWIEACNFFLKNFTITDKQFKHKGEQHDKSRN